MNLEGKVTDLSLEITTTNYTIGQKALHSKKKKKKSKKKNIHTDAAKCPKVKTLTISYIDLLKTLGQSHWRQDAPRLLT